jgi:hypothetical protein
VYNQAPCEVNVAHCFFKVLIVLEPVLELSFQNMQSEFSPFLTDSDLNIYEFVLTLIENNYYHFTVDDFHFTIGKHETTYEFETHDEFLLAMYDSMTITTSDPLELIQRVSDAYGDLFGEKSPLYNNQDVFELENDNHDMKFIERLRFSEDDINGDVFSKIFDFLPLGDLLTIRRVNKKFNHLATLGWIWKKFCSEIVEDGGYFSHYHTVEIFPRVSWITPDGEIGDELTASLVAGTCGDVFYTTTVSSGVHDLDVTVCEYAVEDVPEDCEEYGRTVAIGVFGNDLEWTKWVNNGPICICCGGARKLDLWYLELNEEDFNQVYDSELGWRYDRLRSTQYPKKWSKTVRIQLDCDKRTVILGDHAPISVPIPCSSFGICVIHCGFDSDIEVDNEMTEMIYNCSIMRHVK